MPLESGSTIAELDESWPLGTDLVLEGDNHVRLTKAVLKAQFPGVDGDGFKIAIISTEDELNYLQGLSSNAQVQIDANFAAATLAQADATLALDGLLLKADITYVDDGLLLKADLTGAAFTGAIGSELDITAFLGGGVGVEISMSELRDNRATKRTSGVTGTGGWDYDPDTNIQTEWGNAVMLGGNPSTPVNFANAFADTSYTVQVSVDMGSLAVEQGPGYSSLTASGFSVRGSWDSGTFNVRWMVKGLRA